MSFQFLHQPFSTFRLGDYLKAQLTCNKWTSFVAAVAYVKRSGTKHIKEALKIFAENAAVKLYVGIDTQGSSIEGLLDLFYSSSDVLICHNEMQSTFHPKVYIFKNGHEAEIVVGSGNLTEGGLFTNCEASLVVHVDLGKEDDARKLIEIEESIKQWSSGALSQKLSLALIQSLEEQNYIVHEVRTVTEDEVERSGLPHKSALFGKVSIPRAPFIRKNVTSAITGQPPISSIGSLPPIDSPERQLNIKFLMTLHNTDVGTGQKTPNAIRRSPEIFIPLIARDHYPAFWGWPDLFLGDSTWNGPKDTNGRGKMDRNGVRIILHGEIILINMFYNPNKRDLRLRNETLRSSADIEDILLIEKLDVPDCDYYVEIIKKTSPNYSYFIGKCNNAVRNSEKLWGYFQ